jgi:signal transduction histidine kinase
MVDVARSDSSMTDLREARQRFLDTGDINQTVRPVVQQSWDRCRAYCVRPGGIPTQHVDPKQLARHREAAGPLMSAAQPVIDDLHAALGAQPHLIALSDAEGIILKLLVDSGADALAQDSANLVEGASWHERDLGCNGIGTALATQDVVILIGPEHFAQDYVDWTCIGIPLHGSDGRLVGALDLSVPNDGIRTHTWGWTLAAARAIDRRLAQLPAQLTQHLAFDDVSRPLHSVRGVIDLLASQLTKASPTHRGFLEEALDQVAKAEQQLTRLVHELADSKVQAERENSAKDRLLYAIAHEIRSPVAAIRDALTVKRLSEHDRKRQDRADEVMSRQLSNISRLMEDLLDLHRANRGQFSVHKERTDLVERVNVVLESLSNTIRKHGHDVNVRVPQSPIWLVADPVRLEQIIANLIINACKYTAASGRIDVVASEEDGDAVLRVSDNGIGIEPSRLRQIFEMFEQVDRDGSSGGLGIGLALVKALVTVHGGHVEAASAGLGEGSSFTVRIPTGTLLDAHSGKRSGNEAGHDLLT